MNAMPAPSLPPACPPAPTRTVLLSPRESEVLMLMDRGFTADEAAGLMQVSRHTVVTFIRRIYQKLEVGSKAEAIFEARCLGLLQA